VQIAAIHDIDAGYERAVALFRLSEQKAKRRGKKKIGEPSHACFLLIGATAIKQFYKDLFHRTNIL
jgi:hypothetical protein